MSKHLVLPDLVRLFGGDEGIVGGEEIRAVRSELLHARPFHIHCNDCWSTCSPVDTMGISNIGHDLPLRSSNDVETADPRSDAGQAWRGYVGSSMVEVEQSLVDVETSPSELELVDGAGCDAERVSWFTDWRSMPLSRIEIRMVICRSAVHIHEQKEQEAKRRPMPSA
jgi:hypothetical protein